MFELFWDLFWIALAITGLALHWPILAIIFFFALAGIVWFDTDDFF